MPPLTPLDIQHKEFTKAMRGYAMHEVDTFLDQVTEEFTRMQDEIARLREQASSAGPPQQAPVQVQAPPPPPPPQPQPMVAEARGGGAGGEEAIARALVKSLCWISSGVSGGMCAPYLQVDGRLYPSTTRALRWAG
jgi:DivIVA domain-containing protein